MREKALLGPDGGCRQAAGGPPSSEDRDGAREPAAILEGVAFSYPDASSGISRRGPGPWKKRTRAPGRSAGEKGGGTGSLSPPLLEDLSFAIRRGEFVALIGPSGCGKSTIFRLLNRLEEPTAGRVEVFPGKSADPGNPDVGREGEARCGYMPQQDLLMPWRTVLQNVRLPLEVRGGLASWEMDSRARQALRDVGLTGWEDKFPRELSGGMRQRASFARTLMTGADLLLLDEPFSALDYLTRLSMRDWLLRQWERDHKTVLFITHDVEEAIFLSTRILAADQSPIRRLQSFDVPLPYPRTEGSLALPEALALKARLIEMFHARSYTC